MFGNQVVDVKVSTGQRPYLMNQERSNSHWARSTATKLWREASFYALTEISAVRGFDRVAFVCRAHYDKGPLPDTGGVYPTVKAIIDGAVDYGIVPDDCGDHNRAEVMMAPHLNRLLDAPHIHLAIFDLGDV